MAKIIINGKEYSGLTDASNNLGIPAHVLKYRLLRGYTGEDLTKAVKKREQGVIIEIDGVQFPSLAAAGRAYKIHRTTVKEWILKGRVSGRIIQSSGKSSEYHHYAQPVVVNDILYPSMSYAARCLKVGYLAIVKRVEKAQKENDKQPPSIYFDTEKDYREKSVVIDGKNYPTIKAAAAELGVNYQTMASRIKNGYYERQKHKEGRA